MPDDEEYTLIHVRDEVVKGVDWTCCCTVMSTRPIFEVVRCTVASSPLRDDEE